MVLKRHSGWWCGVALLCVWSSTASTQQPKANGPAAETSPGSLATQLIKTGLFLISGGGANSLLRFSANGLILVDGKSPGHYRALMSQVKRTSRLSDLPVRYLILTGPEQDRAGNIEQFVTDRVRLVAHQNMPRHLSSVYPSAAKPAFLSIAYDRDHTIRLGGIAVQLLHFGRARTDADSVVYFTNLKVVAVGDLLAAAVRPDYAAGGSLVNWPSVVGEILKLDFDVVVPSTGPPVRRAELEKFKSNLDTLVARGTALVNKRVPKDQLSSSSMTVGSVCGSMWRQTNSTRCIWTSRARSNGPPSPLRGCFVFVR